jgi:hypothetical protein
MSIKFHHSSKHAIMHIKTNFLKTFVLLFSLSLSTSNFISCSGIELGACFTASDNNVSPNDVVTFTNCSNLQTENQACYWSFGDGVDTTVYGNLPVQHAYKTTGQYEVELVTGTGSNESKHTLELSVF